MDNQTLPPEQNEPSVVKYQGPKHTPGPWTLRTEARTPDYGHPYMRLDAGDGVGDKDGLGGFHLSGIISKPDAYLIAASPELFEEVRQAAIELAEAAVMLEDRYPRTAALFSKAAERARAAIAKAMGES